MIATSIRISRATGTRSSYKGDAVISGPLIRYVLSAAFRDRLLIVLALIILIGGSLGSFLGSAAVTEQSVFALVFAIAGVRLGVMAALVLFVVFYVRRAFEAREVEFLLARPISRVSFILSHAIAISLLACGMAAVVVASLFFVTLHDIHSSLPLWGASLAAEFVIMANAAFFFSMILSSATAGAMASLGLYLLARLMGQILSILNHNSLLPGFHAFVWPMKIISFFIPRLDLMAQSSWLVYGLDHSVSWCFVAAEGLVFTAIVTVAATIDLLRRQF